MKKIISVVLALTMIATLGLTAFAAAGDDIVGPPNPVAPQESTSIVKTSTIKEDGTTPGEEYTVAIPAETVLAWEQPSKDVVYTVTAQLMWDHLLEVTVAGNNAMTFATANNSYTLPYTLTGDGADAATSDGPVVLDTDANATKTATVAVAADAWAAVPVAEYADTLTFTATVVTNPNA